MEDAPCEIVQRAGLMSYVDIHKALDDWPYDPDKISVRKILGVDGEVRIQMRIEMGIVQLQTDGRPDGVRPHGQPSLLDYHKERLARHEALNGTPLGFALTPQECHALRCESSMYYRRYVAYFVLEEFEEVVADTAHSLAIFDLCRENALEPEDRTALEEFRPYVMMMHARGLALHAVQENEHASALAHVNRGLMMVQSFYKQSGVYDICESSEEIKLLRSLAREIGGQVPEDSLVVARRALRDAIEQERFEEAARLRDEMKTLYPGHRP